MTGQSIYFCLAESIEKNGFKYLQILKSVKKKISVDSVHELRVTIRKIEAALELLEPLGFEDEKLAHELKHIRKLHGSIRNIHVELESIKNIKTTISVKAFKNFLNAKKIQEEKKILKKLKIISIKNQRTEIKKLVFKLLRKDTPPVNLKASRLLEIHHHQIIKEFKKVKTDYSPKSAKSIHNIRIISKKIRYQCEILKPSLKFSDINLLKYKFYQDALGKFQNNTVLQKSINKYLKKHGKIESKLVLKLQMHIAKEQNNLIKRITKMKLA